MARLSKIKKADLFLQIADNCIAKFTLECSICGCETESSGDFCYGDSDAELNQFQNELYDDGWRVFNSKEYNQIGLTCGSCIQNEIENA